MAPNTEIPTILVVEDEQIVALDIQERLEQLGYRVPVTVATGIDAIRQAAAQKPDLILMDIKLQGDMDGIDAAARIHETLDVPVVYLTAFGDDATVGRAEITEPYGYVLKPFKERELKIAIEMALFRHHIMRRLSESEAWLAATVQSVADAVIAIDPDDCIRLMNAEAERLTGFRRDEAIGQPLSDVFRLERRAPPDNALCAAANEPPVQWLKHRAGSTHCIEMAKTPIRGADGRSHGSVLAFRDVSERNRRQEAQRIMLEAGSALASTLDIDASIAALSGLVAPRVADGFTLHLAQEDKEAGALRILAVQHADPAIGAALRRALGEALAEGSSSVVAEVARTGVTRRLDDCGGARLARALGASDEPALARLSVRSILCVPLAARGRTFGALTLLSTSPGPPKDALDIALAEDLGRRAAAALDNAALYGEAQRAIRVRDDMMAIVSHDLRNPLTTVLANTELLLRAPDTEAQSRSKLVAQGIRRAALRMQRLIGDLLDVARIDKNLLSLDLGFCSVAALVEEALDAFQPMQMGANKTAKLVANVPCGDELVRCDRERIAQVFSNLLSNARAWTGPDGTITVSAEPRDGEVCFGVSDTGPGISETELPRLFRRFFRGTGAGYSGAGLGLYISKGIVDAHGGRIWVESEPGRGATFYFTLPSAAEQRAAG